MDKCYKMVGAFFSRVTSSHSRRREANPPVVDVIRAVPHNGVPAKETATGAYKAGVWVWDAPSARTSPRVYRPKYGESSKAAQDKRTCHSMERGVEPGDLRHQLSRQQAANFVTPSTVSVLDNDVKHASLSRRPQSANICAEKTDKYMTLPHVTCSSNPGSRQALNSVTRNVRTEGTSISQRKRTSRHEEVRRLAKGMVDSIENLIDNLHGIVGDLRQLVQQIDAVTDSIDAGSSSTVSNSWSEPSTGQEHRSPVSSKHAHTQTDSDHQRHSTLDRGSFVRKCDSMQPNPSHRYSYPQHCRSPVSGLPSAPGFDTDGGMRKRSMSSRRSADGSQTVQIIVKSSNQHKQSLLHRERRRDQSPKVKLTQSFKSQQRPMTFNGASFEESLGPSLTPTMCDPSPEPSMPFILVESPPNPAPTLFSAYKESNPGQVKDSDSLPNRGLKDWKEKMERHCGSADSLTPQMDWSYLVLTDPHLSATMEECKKSSSSEHKQLHTCCSVDPTYLQNCSGFRVSGHNLETRRVQKDRSRLSQSGLRLKHPVGTITRIPEQGEPCDNSYDEDCDVFTNVEADNSASAKWPSANASQSVKESVNAAQNGGGVIPDIKISDVLPEVRQDTDNTSLGWNTCSKPLPNWPSEDLSSIAASDGELDDLSSPFVQQHFQYPRRSSALDSSSEKNSPDSDPRMNRASSVPETISSGGFEVRTDVEASPESDALATYGGQYENAMESRLEKLTNEVECSDFSDADADVGSDVLEQSLTSLEETSSAKYDRELNTWTSYTMTHIDSDDVVSECTSDILNENLLEMVTTNPGFDDVSLNFDDIGFMPLSLQNNALEKLSPSLE